MRLAVTIDVEEEGLFSGSYEAHPPGVRNVAELASCDPLFREWGIRPTLLVSYPVARDGPSAELLAKLRALWDGEIGAHLHHWNTPPFEPLPGPAPAASETIPSELLSAKLRSLVDAISVLGPEPRSFRMGRYNMGPRMFAVLERSGFEVDSSIAPLRAYRAGPDHFAAPCDPYFPDPERPVLPGRSRILEAPLTFVPVLRGMGPILERLRRRVVPLDGWITAFAKYLGALPVQPMWRALPALKAAVLLHARRGGRVLTLSFHSSELLPGAHPRHRTPRDVDRFRDRLDRFFAWLRRERRVESLTLSEIGAEYRRERLAGA
jgi:hypothetical protein